MQAAVAIISVSRSIHHKLSFHCHVMYIFPKYFMYVCIYFQNKGIRIRIRIRITLTTSQVQEAIKQSKNNNSQGPDKLNIRHLKHIGPVCLKLLLTKT